MHTCDCACIAMQCWLHTRNDKGLHQLIWHSINHWEGIDEHEDLEIMMRIIRMTMVVMLVVMIITYEIVAMNCYICLFVALCSMSIAEILHCQKTLMHLCMAKLLPAYTSIFWQLLLHFLFAYMFVCCVSCLTCELCLSCPELHWWCCSNRCDTLALAWVKEQARKPRSYASSKLRLTDSQG